MKGILRLVIKDWKLLLTHKHGRIALGFLLIVPLIYAGFFLAGYWNPYGKLDQLPVAVVNLDKGAVMKDQSIQAGRDFVGKLKENNDLNFQFVSPAAAEDGLEQGNYYMVVTVPEDFSQKVSTLMDKKPQPAQLLYKTNPGKNYVASQITSTAVEKMKTKLANSITKSYTEGVFNNMQEMANGFHDAGTGAGQLHQGVHDASDGMGTLYNGIQQLNNGAARLEDGNKQLTAGEQKLSQGVKGLQEGTAQLLGGLSQLASAHQSIEAGASKVSQGTKAWADGNAKLEQGQAQLENTAKALQSQLQQYLQQHPDQQADPDLQKALQMASGVANAATSLQNGQHQLAASAESLVGGQSKLEDGLKQFGEKLNNATEGSKRLTDGANQLASGFTQWEGGYQTLSGGIANLAVGEKQADAGANQLANGLLQLNEGSGELSAKLNDAAQKTSDIHSSDATNSMFSEPVQLVESKLSEVSNYGTGIAPYFLSLAFYVGGIMASNILPLGRRQDQQVTGTVLFGNKLGLVYSIGLIQSVIVDLIVLFAFKLEVASVPMFLLSSLIISFTFMTLILMLVTVFGIVGKFAAVTLLVLQLATCGGTFPGELSDPVLRVIGQWLPMAHSLRGLQSVISLGDWSDLRAQIFILLGYLVCAALIGWIASHMQHRKSQLA